MAKSRSDKGRRSTCHVVVGRTGHSDGSEVVDGFVTSSKEGDFSIRKVHDSVKESVGFCGRLVDRAYNGHTVVSLGGERSSVDTRTRSVLMTVSAI